MIERNGEAQAQSPGAKLAAARERAGLTIPEVAERLRLDVDLLRALEADRLAIFGAEVFARGHLRRYAELLGIPVSASDIDAANAACTQVPPRMPDLRRGARTLTDVSSPVAPLRPGTAAVLNIARLDEPPMRLLLGRDAVRAAAEAERTRAEADRKWRSLSESTDFIDDAGQTSNPAWQSSTGGRADLKSRTWLITGASNGLGYALAEFVLRRGDRVVLAARSMKSMSGLAARYPDRALAVGLDVTQPQQRIAAVVKKASISKPLRSRGTEPRPRYVDCQSSCTPLG